VSQSAERSYRNFLSLDAIVAEARAIADTEGLDAVSMRALADRLGCTPRALYRHVSDKEEVLELLADSALADLPLPALDSPWLTALHDYFTGMYELLVTSPAVAAVIAHQAVAGQQFRTTADHLVGLLLKNGFPPDTAVEAVVTFAQFTLGAALPGTSQRLYDIYQTRSLETDQEPLPALSHVQQHFAKDNASSQFQTALKRLIGAYKDVPPRTRRRRASAN
jgi:TetR/AcrR family transcriptional regulator, tetracycline repressor protein